jgi:hypothetical protein
VTLLFHSKSKARHLRIAVFVALACGFAVPALGVTGSLAQTAPPGSIPGTAPVWSSLDELINDIIAYQGTCDQDPSSQSCRNLHADLAARQQKLRIPDQVVNDRLAARGAPRDWHSR